MELKDKKVLLVGLGILGGGVATTRWLVEQGVILTVTDMKEVEYLKSSIDKLFDIKEKINFVLGKHNKDDFLNNEIIVVNPDVPIIDNVFLKLAKENGKQIENELTLFYKFCPSKNIIAVTGTRGKTTTTNWIGHLLKKNNPKSLIAGNSPKEPLLEIIKKIEIDTPVVIEEPSFLLEIFAESGFTSHTAIITNLYRDHINRHKTEEGYALAKANIFKNQKSEDFLVLNYDNQWTDFFIKQNPKAKILFFSKTQLPDLREGIFVDDGEIKIRFNKKEEKIIAAEKIITEYGEHNLENFLAAVLAVFVSDSLPKNLLEMVDNLPQIKFRQEKVYEDEFLKIYNDSAATSPEAGIVATERFKKSANFVLISGGTDRELDFEDWATFINKSIKPGNLILLSGSATEKMKKNLNGEIFKEFDSLKRCFEEALILAKNFKDDKTTIVFSPAAKSFEKFKNEFDRGEKFNLILNELLVKI